MLLLYILIPFLRSLWVIIWNSLMNLEWIENMKHDVSQVREWVWFLKFGYSLSLISCLRSLCYIVWFIINLNNIIPFWDHCTSLCEIHWNLEWIETIKLSFQGRLALCAVHYKLSNLKTLFPSLVECVPDSHYSPTSQVLESTVHKWQFNPVRLLVLVIGWEGLPSPFFIPNCL